MKTSKLLLSLSLCGSILVAGTGTALAAAGDGTTKGSIDFTTSDLTGDIVKPETDDNEIIKPDGGNQTEGVLRIQYVPDFNFGDNVVKTGKQTFNPTYMSYESAKDTPKVTKFMPHFVQVTDVSGTNKGFELKVSQSVFERQTSGDKLPYATMTFNKARLSNTVHSDDEIKTLMNTFVGDNNAGAGVLEIPHSAAGAVPVMKTLTGKTTNGTQTSLVLSETYDKDKQDYLATDKNLDVVFTKTNKDLVTVIDDNLPADPYVSTISWTLEAAP